MDFSEIIKEPLIKINADYNSKEDAILKLVDVIWNYGALEDKKEFLDSVLYRETLGSTGVGMGLAIPHGKSKTVKKAAAAIAILKNKIEDWESIEENDKIELVVLLAIPESEGNDLYLDLLGQLSAMLADDDFRNSILSSKTEKEVIEKFTSYKKENEENESDVKYSNDKYIVCITACPAGIAHTYMSADALEKAGKKAGIKVKVEKQGANGIENKITDEDLEKATCAIFASAVSVKERERFDGLEIIEVAVEEPLKKADELIERASKFKRLRKRNIDAKKSDSSENISIKEEIKRSILTGISYVVPIIVAGGTILAFTVLIAQIFSLQEVYNLQNSWLWLYRQLGSGLLGTMMVPILSAYMSFSISEKPGLAPGIAGGIAANLIGSGFLGGLASGLIAGYTMKFIKKYIKINKSLNGFLVFYLYPVLGSLITGTIMLFIIGRPVSFINQGLTNWLTGLSGANAALLGAIIGIFVSFDLGGPVNKSAYAFCIGAIANGNFVPYAAFASIKMVSAFTTTVATAIKPKYFSEAEIETGRTTWLLGFAGITEGAIPLMLEDHFRVIPSFIVGSMVTGAIVASCNIGLQVPGAGIISMFVLENNPVYSKFMSAIIWFGAAIIGTIISTIALIILKGLKYKKQQMNSK